MARSGNKTKTVYASLMTMEFSELKERVNQKYTYNHYGSKNRTSLFILPEAF